MAEIISHRHTDPFTQAQWFTYEWDGPLWETARISIKLSDDLDSLLNHIPFTLEIVKREPWYGYVEVCRLDGQIPFYAYHRFMKDWEALLGFCQGVKARFIVTCSIWGVGRVEPYETVDWYCLFRNSRF